ncbi:MAG: hypothetical protein IT423_14840 [Pirellulaceae bacterium]|nr:hypothetical protein [Pirellulaceae bacterium]
MEWMGRLPSGLCSLATDLQADAGRLEKWGAGRIVTANGRLRFVQRRWIPYRAHRLGVWWDMRQRLSTAVQCELLFHHRWGNPDFLVLSYVKSHARASLASLYCASLALDEIARLKRSHAIVAEINNPRISDRLLERWGWERHCLSWRGRHFIKRFYGVFPAIPEVWQARLRPDDRPQG